MPWTEPAPEIRRGVHLIACGVCTGLLFVLADAVARPDWDYFPHARHWIGGIGLYVWVGALGGLFAWGLTWVERELTRRVQARSSRWTRVWTPARLYAVPFALFNVRAAIDTFSGAWISRTFLAVVGPILFLVIVSLLGLLLAHITLRAHAELDAGRSREAVRALTVLLGAAVIAAYLDLTTFVDLYYPLHVLLELSAGLGFGVASSLGLRLLQTRWARTSAFTSAIALVAVTWFAVGLLLSPVRVWLDNSLKHVWLNEIYFGRMLRRVETLEAFASDPLHFQGLSMSRAKRLLTRYEIKSTELGARWREPVPEDATLAATLQELRSQKKPYNIIIYYVDTLRGDVAHDPATMPTAVQYGKSSLDFLHAYATGSDTLRSLPGLTSGNYDVHAPHPGDILDLARRTRRESALIIAKSAYEFLDKLRPSFRFDRTVQIQDYPEGMQVWGYGAKQPTARAVVDRGLDFLKKRRKNPFLLWLFNFDVHNWAQFDEDYTKGIAKRYGIREDAALDWHYRAIARSIDVEFARLLAGIDRLNLADKTIVLFVSDHGEALGRDGFWVHSVFLWESLIRVPLILRIPGVPPLAVEDAVSLADVAPTLARYMKQAPSFRGYHGEDLLGYTVSGRPPRRYPILFTAASRDMLVRVGLIDPSQRRKLVLWLDTALPETYDLDAADPDARNLADVEPKRTLRLVREIAHSPVFPRSPDDFDLMDPTPRSSHQ